MELSLDSALSTGGLVGHTSFLLLIVSMLMRRLYLLRLLVIASALVAIVYDVVYLKDPVGAFWDSLLVTVNVIQLLIVHIENKWARFTEEEARFGDDKLAGLAPAGRRRLFNRGMWVSGGKGTELTRQHEPVDHLVFLAEGNADIYSAGKVVAECVSGAFIGEMTVMSGEPATGTAVLNCDSRYWMIEAETLRKLCKSRPEIGHALEASFSLNLKDKLVRSNNFNAGTPGGAAPAS